GVAALALIPVTNLAQEAGYPIEIIKPGQGTPAYPPGYQTPWEKVQIMGTRKMSPNLFVLHGSEALDPAHPDASGGRVMVLFGPDGVLMGDTEKRQGAEKSLPAPARANGQPAPAPDPAAVPLSTYTYNPAARGQPAVTLSMDGEDVDFI